MSVYQTQYHGNACYQTNEGIPLVHILTQGGLAIQSGLLMSMVPACLDQLLLCEASIKYPVEQKTKLHAFQRLQREPLKAAAWSYDHRP